MLNDLNPQQQRAASHLEGPLLILAGAGSGKTKTITYRMVNMLQQGIHPKNILAVSFTNKASLEMKDRVKRLLRGKSISDLTVCTFHALGVKILRQDIHLLNYRPHFVIYDTSDQVALIREITHSFRLDKSFDRKALLSKIGKLKNSGISPESFPNSSFYNPDDEYDQILADIYPRYQEKLKFCNAIDFDDILHLSVKILMNPEVAKKYSEQFRYILVDEYQDTNPLQFQFIKQLTISHQNICVVGDDDQSIYGFRGADIQNILQFERHFPGCSVIKLEQNYRSTMPILELANQVMKKANYRKEKSLWSDQSSKIKPLFWICGHSEHEAQEVALEIKKSLKAGVPANEIAIIYRSNHQAQIMEEYLRMNQVDYTMIGGQKFYDKKEIKDLISYMSLVQNSFDEISLRRIINTPARGIGPTTLKKCQEISERSKISFFQSLKIFLGNPEESSNSKEKIVHFLQLMEEFRHHFAETALENAIQFLVEKLQFLNFIETSHPNVKQQMRRKKDVEMFIESAKRFRLYQLNNGGPRDAKEILKNFLERILLADMQDKNSDNDEEENQNNLKQITMMTLHSSKGLEFEEVYLLGAEEEILPHKKTLTDGNDVDEERRLFYVGITRAKKKLVMTYCKIRKLYNKDVPRLKSRFLRDMEFYYQIEDRTGFSNMTQEEEDSYKNNVFDQLINLL